MAPPPEPIVGHFVWEQDTDTLFVYDGAWLECPKSDQVWSKDDTEVRVLFVGEPAHGWPQGGPMVHFSPMTGEWLERQTIRSSAVIPFLHEFTRSSPE